MISTTKFRQVRVLQPSSNVSGQCSLRLACFVSFEAEKPVQMSSVSPSRVPTAWSWHTDPQSNTSRVMTPFPKIHILSFATVAILWKILQHWLSVRYVFASTELNRKPLLDDSTNGSRYLPRFQVSCGVTTSYQCKPEQYCTRKRVYACCRDEGQELLYSLPGRHRMSRVGLLTFTVWLQSMQTHALGLS